MKQLKLGTKLLIGGLLTVAIPVIVIGVVAVYQSMRSITELAKDSMGNTAVGLAQGLETVLHEQIVTVRNISYTNSAIASAEKVAREGAKNSQKEILLAQRQLTKIKDAEGDRVSSITLVGRNGIVYASSDNGKLKGLDLSGRDYLDAALKGKPNVSSAVISTATGRVVCTAAYPIYASTGKEITGVVVMAMEIKFLTDIVGGIRVGKSGHVYLVDQSGIYITHPEKEKILKENISIIKGMETLVAESSAGKSGVVEYIREGTPKIATFSPIPITGWTVVNSVSTEELYAPAYLTRNVIVSIGVIFLIMASVFFFFFARTATRPLIDLVGAAGKIAGGNLNVVVTSENRLDEIGDLARAFTGMIQSLKDKAQIAQKIAGGDLTVEAAPLSEADVLGNAFSTMVVKLREQIQEILEGVNVLASSGSEIMASVSQLTSGAAETSTAVSETTTTVEEVKQTTGVSSQKAKHVSELGRKSVEISQTGLKSIEDTIQGMNKIKEQVESIADMVVRLSEQSQAIGEIIATVNDLAEQSNLLAVNASIEAAKAGEQGKGFAVVAQEIRSLAAQSKQATTQVRNILFDVQKAISSAVMATEQGSRAVEAGVRLSTQAGEAIGVLAESVTESTNAAIQIAASSQQQLIGMDQVVSAMENIREAALQMASSTKQTEKSAHDLHTLGRKLQEIVKFYKV